MPPKRVAELMTLSLSGPSCQANVIRLGNVIGSTGSVIPLFLEQIEKGQPISVTHPDASRYFLTLNEAVTAILAAGSAACEGKVLLPKLAEPVRIVELASFLANATPGGNRSLPVHFTGLRPGEKVTEDLIGRDETTVGIADGPLTIVQTRTLPWEECDGAFERLSACVKSRDDGGLLEALRLLVPEYRPGTLMVESAAVVSSE